MGKRATVHHSRWPISPLTSVNGLGIYVFTWVFFFFFHRGGKRWAEQRRDDGKVAPV